MSDTRIQVTWSNALQGALDKLNHRATSQGVFEHSMDRTARRALEMIKDGKQPNVDEIVAYMRDHDAPPVGTWAVDEPYFRARAEEIVRTLNKPRPEAGILLLKRI